MLKKYILVSAFCLIRVRNQIAFRVTGYAAALSHSPRFLLTTSVLKRREVLLFFLVAVLLLLFTNRERCAEKNKVGFCFLFDTGAQSMAFSVTRYVLLIFLTATGSCCRPPCRPAIMCVSCYRLLQGHPAWINGAMEHLDPQETQDTTRICRFRTTSPVQGVRT